jgi:hypothetical protein
MEFVRRIFIYLLAIAVCGPPLQSLQAGSAPKPAEVNPAGVQKAKGRKARTSHRRRIVTVLAGPPIDPISPSPPENLFQTGVLPPELFLFRQKAPVLGPPAQK